MGRGTIETETLQASLFHSRDKGDIRLDLRDFLSARGRILSSKALLVLSIASLSLNSCGKPPTTNDPSLTPSQKTAAGSQNYEEPPTVIFDLRVSADRPDVGNAVLYDCTYRARGKTAKFRIQFGHGPLQGEIPMAFGEGKFISVAGSDNGAMIEDLKLALGAKRIPEKVKRVKEVSFAMAVLGERQTRNSGGGSSSKPVGNWITTKIFLPKDGDDGEVYLNLNPVLGKGEFSIKDSDYGDYVLKLLSGVL
jgi:hypothetical protein